MRVAVSGSTGLIGSAVCEHLAGAGVEVLRLVRGPDNGEAACISWDPASTGSIRDDRLEGIDAVIHLAGANIAGRWTEAKRKIIRDSRVQGTQVIARTLAELGHRPGTLLCASAIGIYGDTGSHETDETGGPGVGFLAGVCREWESACAPAAGSGVRVAHLRLGVVLSRGGGALALMLPAFRFGLGGRVGDGRQYMSWITLPDTVATIEFILREDSIRGPVNLVSPSPVTNAEFTRALGIVLHRPTLLPVPAFVLKLLLREMAEDTLLCSNRVVPRVLLDAGFTFQHPTVEFALRETLQPTGVAAAP